MRVTLSNWAFALFLSLPGSVPAEQSASFGEYTVHYNALTTDIIDPLVARAHGIVRSRNRALVNIAVLREVMGAPVLPVKADVEVTATNLSSQFKTIEIRELLDSGAIYYIGELPVDHTETLNFTVKVTPEGTAAAYTVNFRHQFFTK